MPELELSTKGRDQALNVTARVAELVAASGLVRGWCRLFVPHTTAGLVINEAADPDVMVDVLAALDRLAPWQGPYRHAEGNSAAHIKAILAGASLTLPVREGRLDLGTWQGIFFMEFDGPRRRRLWVELDPA